MKKLLLFLALTLVAKSQIYAEQAIIFEDVKIKEDIMPFIQENINSPFENVSVIESQFGKAIISIVLTPNKLIDGNPNPKGLMDMFKITLAKGRGAISKFIQTSISSETVLITSTTSRTILQNNSEPNRTVQKNKTVNELIKESSSLVMVNSRAVAYWYTEDKQFFKRAVILNLNNE